MKPIDRKQFLEIVIGFAELKGKSLSVPALELYWNSMQDWEMPDFQVAANRLLKTSEFMPTPKDFEDLRKAGRMTAGEAFAKAIAWAKSGGYRHPARTSDAILIDRVVASLGGWTAVAGCDPEKLHFLERRFSANYETIQGAEDTREAVPQIAYGDAPLQLNHASGTFKSVGKLPQPS